MFTVAPKGRTNFTERLSTPDSKAHSIVRGRVAEELAVPKAVTRALDMLARKSRPRRLMTTRMVSNTKKCRVSPTMTVSMYFPTPAISRRKFSPPPVSPSLAAIREKMPMGAKYMIQMTIFIITSFMASKKSNRGLPRSPTADKATANKMENTMTSSNLVSAADFTMFEPISERMMSTNPVSSLPETRSGTTWLRLAASPIAAPGCMMLTMISPNRTAMPVVQK